MKLYGILRRALGRAGIVQGYRHTCRARLALRVLDGGKGNLLSVRAVAEHLGVSTATVYGLCGRGELRHVRVSNAIRIEPTEVRRSSTATGGG